MKKNHTLQVLALLLLFSSSAYGLYKDDAIEIIEIYDWKVKYKLYNKSYEESYDNVALRYKAAKESENKNLQGAFANILINSPDYKSQASLILKKLDDEKKRREAIKVKEEKSAQIQEHILPKEQEVNKEKEVSNKHSSSLQKNKEIEKKNSFPYFIFLLILLYIAYRTYKKNRSKKPSTTSTKTTTTTKPKSPLECVNCGTIFSKLPQHNICTKCGRNINIKDKLHYCKGCHLEYQDCEDTCPYCGKVK